MWASEQEAWVMRHEEEILAERILSLLQPLVLTWLEAAVLLHHYMHGFRLPEVAARVNRHIRDVQQARDSLIRKAAVVLGYIEGDVELAAPPMSREDRRREVARLRKQGLTTVEIARRLGVHDRTVRADLRALKEPKGA